MRLNQVAQRIQIERPKRLARVDILFVVSDQQCSVDQMNIDLDADEAERQGVPQGGWVQVVVVRVAGENRLARYREGGAWHVLRGGERRAACEQRENG